MIRAAALALLAALALGPAAAALAAPAPRTSLADVEDEVMCTVCGVPLDLAREAPAAQRERALIASLVAQGRTKAQIKRVLVATYGTEVLSLPRDEGFDRAAYLVPLAAVLAGLAGLALVVRRARRRRPAARPEPAPLAAADARRLDEDLARFDS
ncbi:MAG: cytochrome c-type biogenesis protein CcmH [Solirubrobacteraceae bacterium]